MSTNHYCVVEKRLIRITTKKKKVAVVASTTTTVTSPPPLKNTKVSITSSPSSLQQQVQPVQQVQVQQQQDHEEVDIMEIGIKLGGQDTMVEFEGGVEKSRLELLKNYMVETEQQQPFVYESAVFEKGEVVDLKKNCGTTNSSSSSIDYTALLTVNRVVCDFDNQIHNVMVLESANRTIKLLLLDMSTRSMEEKGDIVAKPFPGGNKSMLLTSSSSTLKFKYTLITGPTVVGYVTSSPQPSQVLTLSYPSSNPVKHQLDSNIIRVCCWSDPTAPCFTEIDLTESINQLRQESRDFQKDQKDEEMEKEQDYKLYVLNIIGQDKNGIVKPIIILLDVNIHTLKQIIYSIELDTTISVKKQLVIINDHAVAAVKPILLFNHLETYYSGQDNNDTQSNLYFVATDSQVSVYTNKDNNSLMEMVWSLPLSMVPNLVSFVNTSFTSFIGDDNDSDDEDYDDDEWSKGCVIIVSKHNLRVYSIGSKKLMAEATGFTDLFIDDFIGTGREQVLLRMIVKAQKQYTMLAIIPLHKHRSVTIPSSNGGTDNNTSLSSGSKQPVSIELVTESLKTRCEQAKDELKDQQAILANKQQLLNHSIKVLDSLGTNGYYNQQRSAQLKNEPIWNNSNLKSLLNPNNNINIQQRQQQKEEEQEQNSPILESYDLWFKNNIIYCLWNLKCPTTTITSNIIIESLFIILKSNQTPLQCRWISLHDGNSDSSFDENHQCRIYMEIQLQQSQLQSLLLQKQQQQFIDVGIQWRKHISGTLIDQSDSSSVISFISNSLPINHILNNTFKSHQIESPILYPIEFEFIILSMEKDTNMIKTFYQNTIPKLIKDSFSQFKEINNLSYEFNNIEGYLPFKLEFIDNNNSGFGLMKISSFQTSVIQNVIGLISNALKDQQPSSSSFKIILSFGNRWYKNLIKQLEQSIRQEIQLMEVQGCPLDSKKVFNKQGQKDLILQLYELNLSLSRSVTITEGCIHLLSRLYHHWSGIQSI
ncbi:hypothetical protein DFA_05066 [Cavenderia fasciculata]|uniref:Uncharacterized protein n=1 Tax=Cavenderia fasciculata TaxID=261658 RepID=F4PN83_CACFS|nr:uncharacterized protein DFA_05066 [Cavenderia fasciculata]EGG22936.1 hypothetical protein DFA_05066 [Cavenderia fasciculata]|eukprot:XP_004360787.1 hypothetical protein DFA_05066 [Cavenderia fasciculata]